MLSAILSFLGGSAFRMLWGEISAFLTKRQDQRNEIERMRLQGELDAAQHARNLEAIRVQADLGVQTIRVQAEGAVTKAEADAWREAVVATGRQIGVAWVDAWNAAIRPGVATWAVFMLTCNEFGVFTISETTAGVCFSALGLFLADRALGKRGK